MMNDPAHWLAMAALALACLAAGIQVGNQMGRHLAPACGVDIAP